MNQAIEILATYLTQKNQLGYRTLLRDAEAHAQTRLINTTGDTAIEGVSVVFAVARRTQIIVEAENSGTASYTRAEAAIEALTLSTPSASSGTWPVPMIPGVSPLSYSQLTQEELALVTGADVFLPALQDALIAKAKAALTPPPPPGPV